MRRGRYAWLTHRVEHDDALVLGRVALRRRVHLNGNDSLGAVLSRVIKWDDQASALKSVEAVGQVAQVCRGVELGIGQLQCSGACS